MTTNHSLDVLIIGGGMITCDLILPSVYHLQRLGAVRRLSICGRRSAPLRALRDNAEIQQAFPGQIFEPLCPSARAMAASIAPGAITPLGHPHRHQNPSGRLRAHVLSRGDDPPLARIHLRHLVVHAPISRVRQCVHRPDFHRLWPSLYSWPYRPDAGQLTVTAP